MLDYDGLHLIPLFPLLGAATLGLIGRRLDHEKVNLIALSALFASFIVCCLSTYKEAVSGSALQQELILGFQWGDMKSTSHLALTR